MWWLLNTTKYFHCTPQCPTLFTSDNGRLTRSDQWSLVIYSEETHYWEQLSKGRWKEKEQEGSQGSRCLTGSWQKDTPSSATMNWNPRHKTDWNGVITTRTCQLRQRTKKKKKKKNGRCQAPFIATHLNSTGRPVELSCVAKNGA